jgi:hypothetical protein
MINALGDAAKVIATLIAAYQIYLLIKETRRKTNFERNKATLDYMTSVNESYKSLRGWLFNSAPDLSNISDISSDDREKIIAYLRITERLSLGIQEGVYSLPLVKRMMSTTFRRAYKKLEPYILSIRNVPNEIDGTTNKQMWCESEWLYLNMSGSVTNRIDHDSK